MPDSSTLEYRAVAGERNQLSVDEIAPGRYELTDRAPMVAGAGCETEDGPVDRRVVCTLPANLPAKASIRVGDRDDGVRFDRVSVAAIELRGGAGHDFLDAPRSEGGYLYEWEALALGGSEPRFGTAARALAARPSATILGGSGNDHLDGGDGDDLIAAGGGRDLIRGSGGDDRVLARDGSFDLIECDAGLDRVMVDRLDFAWNRCGKVRRRSAPLAAPLAAELDIGDRDIVTATVGCPADATRVCKGRLIASVRRGSRLFVQRYSAAPGRLTSLLHSVGGRAEERLLSGGALLRVSSRDRAGRLRWVSRTLPIEDPYADPVRRDARAGHARGDSRELTSAE
jgi:hypothetical protein